MPNFDSVVNLFTRRVAMMQRAVVVRGGELRAGAGAGRTPEGKTGRAARPSVNSAPPPVPRHPPGSGLHRLHVRLTRVGSVKLKTAVFVRVGDTVTLDMLL